MKLSVISALLILIIPTAWADNNGGLQRVTRRHRRMRWTAVIVVPMMRAL